MLKKNFEIMPLMEINNDRKGNNYSFFVQMVTSIKKN